MLRSLGMFRDIDLTASRDTALLRLFGPPDFLRADSTCQPAVLALLADR